MARKLQCPRCKKILKELGDLGKDAEGEYSVIDATDRKIKCIECAFIDNVSNWN